jgi:hypothetical protein
MGRLTRGQVVRALVVSLVSALLGLAFDAAIAYFRKDWTNPIGVVAVILAGTVPGLLTLPFGAQRERTPHPPPRRVSAVPVVLVILLVIGGGVGLVAYGGHYLGGWVTGNEEGPDILVAKKSATVGTLTLTVERIRHTAHFTRVDLTATNTGDESLSLPVYGYSQLTPERGTTMQGESFQSDWPISVPGAGTVRGTVNFGRLPSGTTKLNVGFTQIFGPGGNSITVKDVRVRL